ncbi:MAG TPA: hypothetical protein VFH51_19085 [Myxococcota bacterium]|nr:hypothetical protein [Myxococcota bacterium]
MKFSLDFELDTADASVDSATFLKKIDSYRGELSDINALEGRVVVRIDGKDVCGEYSDPIVRLVDQWLRKLPWIVGGDTETVALRNSEHCFAFVPAAESVEVSYFQGSEMEVEDYIVEPVTLRLDAFVNESLGLGDKLVNIVKVGEPSLFDSSEDCKDLQTSLNEAKRSWREYQLHQRR